MTLKQFQTKYKKSIKFIDDYNDDYTTFMVSTEGKWLSKKECPKGYFISRIGSYGPINKPRLHVYIQDIVPKK